jgi:GNAT superfamily N-acetyltransferase
VSVAARPPDDALGEAARHRVHEPLLQERVVASDVIYATASGVREPWALVVTRGKAPPYGYLDAGRVLVLIEGADLGSEPLAGLVWARERGKLFIHNVWVDPDAQGHGLGRVLVEAYRQHVTPKVVMSGPFSNAGRGFARSIGAKIVNDV